MTLDASNKKIKDYLLEQGLIDNVELDQAQESADKEQKDWEEFLIDQKIITAKKFTQIKGEVFNLESVDLSETSLEPSVLNLLTPKVAENYKMLIFGRQGDTIKVGLAKPGDFRANEAITFLTQQQGLTPKYYAISLDDFKNGFKQYAGFQKEISSALEVAAEKHQAKQSVLSVSPDAQLGEAVKTAPVAKIINVIIQQAVEGGASDIHIEPSRDEARVRYRVDGILRTSINLPSYLHQSLISRIKVLANLKLDETRIPQDGRIRLKVGDGEVDLRVSVLPMLDAEKVVLRILDTSAGVPTLAELGFVDRNIEMMEKNIKKPHGLFLLTGPTGSGKTTTLYSLLNMLNSDDMNITTLEDPIEYYVTGVNQSQVRSDIGFNFASGLRSVLRQDPNIIMVGEIRDRETAELVIHAALTGHLVFSTLHTNDAWGAVPRLIDMGVEPFLLGSTLNLIMAQRLVRKICPDCREEIKLPANLRSKIDAQIKNIHPDLLAEFKGNYKFYHGVGCRTCSQSGYVGRTVVAEMFESKGGMEELISHADFSEGKIAEELTKQKFVNLGQDGVLKALAGVTTIEEVIRVSTE